MNIARREHTGIYFGLIDEKMFRGLETYFWSLEVNSLAKILYLSYSDFSDQHE